MSKQKVLVIVGATGVGKTALSIRLAKHFGSEIISGDSIQVYKGLDIGSAKITEEEKDGVVHHLIDCKELYDRYDVMEFQSEGRKHLDDMKQRGVLPMVVGGTGLYIKALLYDYQFEQEEPEYEISEELEQYTNEQLWEKLKELDPDCLETLHPNNRKRVKRALVMAMTGTKKSERLAKQEHELLYDAFIIGCTMDREKLYNRISVRVDRMKQDGLLEEVTRLSKTEDIWNCQGMQGIGYKEWKEYFLGNKNEEEVLEEIKKHSRQFAKRQGTWFRNQMPIRWYDMECLDEASLIHEIEVWRNTNVE